jgi:hypothetical protein
VRALLEDVVEEKELAALEALLPEEKGKGSGQVLGGGCLWGGGSPSGVRAN